MNFIKLLLVDDDELFASLLKYRLKKEKYEVNTCVDGKAVKKYLESNTPDIIVIDIMLPYFSGLEITDYVRNQLKLKTPIIMISSAGTEENKLNAFNLGVNDFLSKPLSILELIVRLNKQLA